MVVFIIFPTIKIVALPPKAGLHIEPIERSVHYADRAQTAEVQLKLVQ